MFKKILKLCFVFITLFCCGINCISAYDYVNQANESEVTNIINTIYDQKETYEALFGLDDSEALLNMMSSVRYWWPIGSIETTTISGIDFATGAPHTVLTSNGFGCTEENRWRDSGCHNGLDISGLGLTPGTINVIAAQDGKVIYPSEDWQTNYNDEGYYRNPDGGGFGNYVMIQHSDGVYTIYGHLAKNSITVRAGDTVRQGQVIAKVGHSGSSTGPHLHFEVRVGGQSNIYAVDPYEYIDPSNPRPNGFSSFSITSTTLTKEEFVAKMRNYCARTKALWYNQSFCENFADNAGAIYDVSVRNHVNPELVVVTAGAEEWWTLSDGCKATNNYWGIKITNGKTCTGGGIYSSILEGVEAYAGVIAEYVPGGYYEQKIIDTNNQREAAGCDPAGHGGPGTLEGMQMMYSWVGAFRYNPGNNTLGGCVYLDGPMYVKGYCNIKPTCTSYDPTSDAKNVGICPENSRTTICEQNDYTAWQLKKKIKMRYDIFGL